MHACLCVLYSKHCLTCRLQVHKHGGGISGHLRSSAVSSVTTIAGVLCLLNGLLDLVVDVLNILRQPATDKSASHRTPTRHGQSTGAVILAPALCFPADRVQPLIQLRQTVQVPRHAYTAAERPMQEGQPDLASRHSRSSPFIAPSWLGGCRSEPA